MTQYGGIKKKFNIIIQKEKNILNINEVLQ